VIERRWEHGSEFHWMDVEPVARDDDREWLAAQRKLAYASGRGALRALLAQLGWPRVWLPSYVCPELVAAIGRGVLFYRCDPIAGAGAIEAASGDVVVRINDFGLRGPISAASLRARGVVVIEDHTHDPCGEWARASDADYCIASLRKSLPLPDGALIWSRAGSLPRAPDPCDAAGAKLSAMLLKRSYLQGHAIEKAVFRGLAIDGEARLAALGSVGMSRVSAELIASLPIARLRASRRENFAAFVEAIGERVPVLQPEPGATPFACVLRLRDREQRDRVRAGLIEQRIYPAVLWQLGEIPGHRERFADECALADRLLALHCDGRYSVEDMQRVGACVASLSACG
jgi:hypothetical protein